MWAQEIARAPREGLAATKRIVASLRAGQAGASPRLRGALATVDAQRASRPFWSAGASPLTSISVRIERAAMPGY